MKFVMIFQNEEYKMYTLKFDLEIEEIKFIDSNLIDF
jgi:hypothetical protein